MSPVTATCITVCFVILCFAIASMYENYCEKEITKHESELKEKASGEKS